MASMRRGTDPAPRARHPNPPTNTNLLTPDYVGAGAAPRQADPLSTQTGPPRGRRRTPAPLPGISVPAAVIPALLLYALLCVLAPHLAQAQEATWDGTVLVRNTSLRIGPGERTTHYIKLSKKPSINGVDIPDNEEWFVMLHSNGVSRQDGYYRDLTFIPGFYRTFGNHDWDTWKGFSIYRLTDAEWQARKDDDANYPGIDDDTPRATSVRLTHEVWDHTTNCPVHDAGPVTLGYRGGNGGNNNNPVNPDNPVNPNDANDLNDPDNSNNPNVPNVPDAPAPDAPNVVTVDTNENGGSGGTDSTVTTPPGGSYTFTADDFTGSGGGQFECVQIVTLPADGVLTLNGVAVNAGDEIRKSDIDAGRLVFTPDEGGSGSPYTSFTYRAGDCGALNDGPESTVTIHLQYAPPPRAPGRPKVTQSGDGTTSLDANWTAPANTHCPNGCPEITHYRLQYRRGTGGIWESWTDVPGNVPDTSTTISVPDLESRYQVRVHAVNAEGTEGEWSRPGTWLPPGEQASDRLMSVWLPRFARTVSDQVIDAVGARLEAPVVPDGLQANIAGQRLAGARDRTGFAASPHAQARGNTGPAHYHPYSDQYDAWHGAGDGTEPDVRTRGFSGTEMLRSSSFSYASGDTGTGMLSVWGRGAASAFDGYDDSRNLEVDGEVRSLLLGTDFRHVRGVFGTLLAHSSGRGDYQGETDGNGRIHASLTGMYPYASYEVSRDLSLWGIAGFGRGEARTFREDEALATRDIDLLMATGGLRSRLPEIVPEDPFIPAIDAVADVMAVQISSDGPVEAGIDTEAEVTRLRMGLEGTWETMEAGGGNLTPVMRVGLRADGGDADRGFGTDFEARLHWYNPDEGIRMQLRYHGLLLHEEDKFREIGLSGSVSWDPEPATRRGAVFSLAGGMREAATWDAYSLLANLVDHGVLAGLADVDDAGRDVSGQIQAKVGYGIGVFDGRYTGIPELGAGWSDHGRDYTAGWRLRREGSNTFEMLLEATHHEDGDDGGAWDEFGLRLRAFW